MRDDGTRRNDGHPYGLATTRIVNPMLPAHGLYGHMRNNNIKSAALIVTFGLYIALLWFACCLVWTGLSTRFEPIIMRLGYRKPTLAGLWDLTLTRPVGLALAYAAVAVIDRKGVVL